MKKLSYVKWVKPTKEELDAALTAICIKYDLPAFEEEQVRLYNSDIISFIATAFYCSTDTAKNYCRNPEKMKFPVWIILNALADNDISEYVKVNCNYSNTEQAKDLMSEILGSNAFESGECFHISPRAYDILFKSDYVCNIPNFVGKNGNKILSLSTMTRREFSDSLSINYTVFCRILAANNMRYIHAKIFLLTLGFSVEEIGLI